MSIYTLVLFVRSFSEIGLKKFPTLTLSERWFLYFGDVYAILMKPLNPMGNADNLSTTIGTEQNSHMTTFQTILIFSTLLAIFTMLFIWIIQYWNENDV